MKKSVLLLSVFLLLTFLTAGCTPRTVTRSTVMLDTTVSFTLYNSENISIINQAIALCKKYENLFSLSVPDSDVAKLNRANGSPVKVSLETLEILKRAIQYAELSEGLFDVTIQSASALWNFKTDNPALPESKALSKAISKVDYRNIVIGEDNTVTLKNGAQIDLSAIAKGYIARQAADFIRQSGIDSAIVDLGGNMIVIGKKDQKENFTVGIRKPFDKNGGLVGTISVADKAVVTSGVYLQYFELEGKRYHHILDPQTGYPVESDLLSATVIGDDPTQCDALSTLCILLGLDEAMELVRKLGLDAVFIDNTNQITVTPGFTQKYNPRFETSYREYVD